MSCRRCEIGEGRRGDGEIFRSWARFSQSIEEDREFCQAVKAFVQDAENDVTSLLEEEKKIMALVRSTGDYFHGKAGKDEGLRVGLLANVR
ncbi:hypothetical protein K1719_020681 [Acacia pycnantha]|nr:hypothetical protein K1719_020681 [Acacia pycnantha]